MAGNIAAVSDIEELISFAAAQRTIEVTDLVRGGTFEYSDEELTPDGGTIFLAEGLLPEGITEGKYWVRKYDTEFVNVKWFDAKGDGVTDDYEALNNAISNFDNIYIPEGDYLINSQVTKTGSIIIKGDGIDKTILRSGDFSIENFPDRVLIYIKGNEADDLGLISVDANNNDDGVTLTTGATLNEGDIVALANTADESYSGYRPEYKEGEFLTIKDAITSSTAVTFTSRLLGQNYVAATTHLYRMNMAQSCEVSGMTIIGTLPSDDSRTTALKLGNLANGKVSNIKLLNASSVNLQLALCYNFIIENIQDNKTQDDETSTSYGIGLANVQNVSVYNSIITSSRHALSLGGDDEGILIVNRGVNINNSELATVDNNLAADIHGNSEYCNFEDNIIIGGIVTGGHANTFRNNVITNLYNSTAFVGSELKSTYQNIIGNTIIVSAPYNGTNGSVAYFEIGTDTNEGGVFTFSNNNIKSEFNAGDTTVNLVQFYKSGYANGVKLQLENNNFYIADNTALVRAFYIRKVSGRTNYEEVFVGANTCDFCALGLFQHTDNVIVTNGNRVTGSDRQGIYINDVGNFIVSNNWFKNNNQSSSGTTYLNAAVMVLTATSGYLFNNVSVTNGAQALYGYTVRDVPTFFVGSNSSTGHTTSKYNLSGTTVSTNILELPATPTTSAGSYDILTRNTTTGAIEKILSSAVYNSATQLGTGGSSTTQLTSSTTILNAIWQLQNQVNAITDANLSKTANYTVLTTDFGRNGILTIFVDANSAAVQIELPAANLIVGKTVNVIKTDATANAVTIKGNGSTNINAANTYVISAQFDNVAVKSNGTQYYIFG